MNQAKKSPYAGGPIILNPGESHIVSVERLTPASGPSDAPPGSTNGTPGPRPGHEGNLVPAAAPEFLDFLQTTTLLKELSEDQFRAAFVETLLQVDDLGLNRSKGEARSQAYLDMVTWDAKTRTSYTNDHSGNSSSCGMFIRNIWWLCGARGTKLFDAAYSGGVITHLLDFEASATSTFHADTFLPMVGDMLYLYKETTDANGTKNISQHVFTIVGLDKTIGLEDGKATIRNPDGSLASEITFTSVDGGQSDGVGSDGRGTPNIKWGCQATKTVTRTMKLNNGHWRDLSKGWPLGDGTTGRPVARWVSIWKAKDKFTAPWIKPVRNRRET